MAPSLSTATGVPEQILDDPRLVKLHREAHDLKLGDADALVALLRPWQEWVFEEQVRHLSNVFRAYHVNEVSHCLYRRSICMDGSIY